MSETTQDKFCSDEALEALRAKLVPGYRPEAITTYSHEDLVRLACSNQTLLHYVRDGRPINAIKALRAMGDGTYIGLLPAKEAVADPRVAEASKVPTTVYVVSDQSGDRIEVYLDEQDADERVQEIDAKQGVGYAWKDTTPLYALGQRPTHPLHGI